SAIENRKLVGIVALASILTVCGARAEAQQPAKIPVIGILGATLISDAPRRQAIRRALREIGYIEGQNILIEERYFEGPPDRRGGAKTAAELVRRKVDLIIAAGGNNVVQAAIDATNTIPIVMIGQGTDPVVAGFVKSLARPGGNVTGLSNLG